MKKRIFTGAGVAIITPFYSDGSVNYDKLKELIDFQIDGGTDAIIICGTTGESPTLNHEEHLKTIQVAVEHTAGRVPVVASTGSNDTKYAILLAQEAENLGADGLLVVTPYYNKTSQKGIVEHYYAIADSVHTPIIVYHIPPRTGLTIKPATFLELSKHPNIVGVKEASGDIGNVVEIRALCKDALDIYSGNDDQIVPLLSVGGVGVISVLSNILPRQTHDMCQFYFDGRVQESMELQLKYWELINALFMDVNPIPVKEAMNLMGMDVGSCRLPLCDMDDLSKTKLRDIMEKYKII